MGFFVVFKAIPGCSYHVSFRRNSPLSAEVVEKRAKVHRCGVPILSEKRTLIFTAVRQSSVEFISQTYVCEIMAVKQNAEFTKDG